MSWAVLLSIATIAVSMVTKSNKAGADRATVATTTRNNNNMMMTEWPCSRTFVSGLCLGMGIQLLLVTLLQQFRIVERFRLYVTKTWENKQDAPWRVPRNFLQSPPPPPPATTTKTTTSSCSANDGNKDSSLSKQYVFQSPHGSVRLLVSSSQAATRSLQMAVVTIRPGCEMPSTRAVSVEVYQVVSGCGQVSQQGVTTTAALQAGQLWMVDPGALRWIQNNGGSTTVTDLVLLRTVDANVAAYAAPGSSLNRITLDSAVRTMSIMEQLSASVWQLGKRATDFYYQSTSNPSLME